MLGVLPKSQGIANKKDDLAKREVIFCLYARHELILMGASP